MSAPTLTLERLESLFFFWFPCFFFRFSLLFGSVFPFFSKEFRGSAKRETLAFFGVSLAFYSKRRKQGLEGQGQKKPHVRSFFPPAILGPEMAALILWAPGIFWFFLLENRQVWLDNPRPSYRAENPTNAKIGQKYQPDIRIPRTRRIEKIPRKYQQKRFCIFGGYSWGYLKGSMKGIWSFVSWGVILHVVDFPIL